MVDCRRFLCSPARLQRVAAACAAIWICLLGSWDRASAQSVAHQNVSDGNHAAPSYAGDEPKPAASEQKGGQQKSSADDKKPQEDKNKLRRDVQGAVMSNLVSIAAAVISLLGAVTALFIGRSSHGEKVGRLRIFVYRFDLAHRRVVFSVENSGLSSVHTIRVRGACRVDLNDAFDFAEAAIEALRPAERIVLVRPLTRSTCLQHRFGARGGSAPTIFIEADYADHGDRWRRDRRAVELTAAGSPRLLWSSSGTRWFSLG